MGTSHIGSKLPKMRDEIKLDEALEDSFPASDPPAQTTPITAPRIDTRPLKKQKKNKGQRAS